MTSSRVSTRQAFSPPARKTPLPSTTPTGTAWRAVSWRWSSSGMPGTAGHSAVTAIPAAVSNPVYHVEQNHQNHQQNQYRQQGGHKAEHRVPSRAGRIAEEKMDCAHQVQHGAAVITALFWWHRPGSRWYRRRRTPPPPPPGGPRGPPPRPPPKEPPRPLPKEPPREPPPKLPPRPLPKLPPREPPPKLPRYWFCWWFWWFCST